MISQSIQHPSKTGSVTFPLSRAELGRALIERDVPDYILAGLRGTGRYALVVVAPTSGHVEILVSAFSEMPGDDFDIHCLLGSPGTDLIQAMFESLIAGKPVVVVCSERGLVPPWFGALADETVHIGKHDATVLRRVLRSVIGGRIPAFKKNFVVHPDAELLCRCIVGDLDAPRVVKALTRLGETVRPTGAKDVPDLVKAVEFGEARLWGLRLGHDIDAWQRGYLDARDLESRAMLSSPPGYGKSLFAHSLAQSLQLPFFELRVGDLFVGDGHRGSALHELRTQFETAASSGPAVLLIDELDAVGRHGRDSEPDLRSTIVTELLVLMDQSAVKWPGLVIVGATNAPHLIDPALLRPGRLGQTIEIHRPGPQGVENILRHHLRSDLSDVVLDGVVALGLGKTAAELMGAVRTARSDARAQGCRLSVGHLMNVFGSREPEDEILLRRIAIHGAGHALACLVLADAPGLRSVALIDRRDTKGHVASFDLAGANTRSRIEGRIMMALAGRAAENIVYGVDDPSDGSEIDLQMATTLSCRLHGSLGMGESLVAYPDPVDRLTTDDMFADQIENHLQNMFEAVTRTLERFQSHLFVIAYELLTHRVLTGSTVYEIFQAVEKTVRGLGDATAEDGLEEFDDDLGHGRTLH